VDNRDDNSSRTIHYAPWYDKRYIRTRACRPEEARAAHYAGADFLEEVSLSSQPTTAIDGYDVNCPACLASEVFVLDNMRLHATFEGDYGRWTLEVVYPRQERHFKPGDEL
jgi:hypothetical protein